MASSMPPFDEMWTGHGLVIGGTDKWPERPQAHRAAVQEEKPGQGRMLGIY